MFIIFIQYSFFMEDIVTHNGKSTGVNNINIIFKYSSEPWQCDSEPNMNNTRALKPNQPYLMVVFTPVIFLLWRTSVSSNQY